MTLLIGVASGVITGLALAGLTADRVVVAKAGLRGGARRAGSRSERLGPDGGGAMSDPDGERVRCEARIWPSSWSGWGQCPGYVLPNGNCSAYGSQHRTIADTRNELAKAQEDNRP